MNSRKFPRTGVILASLLVVLLTAGVVDACPSCKAGLDHEHASLARGYFWSIVFMMSMPFLILGGLGSYFYYLVRKAHGEQLELRRGPDAGGAVRVELTSAGAGDHQADGLFAESSCEPVEV